MGYHLLSYFIIFLPIVLLTYQLAGETRRKYVLLIADYVFFFLISKYLLVYLLGTTGIVWYIGKKLSGMKKGELPTKDFKKKKQKVMWIGIGIILGVLFVVKYLNFFMGSIASVAGFEFTAWNIAVPVGISYYTFQGISYLSDVKNKKYPASDSLLKVALYLSFFPTIMEGPITRFNEIADDLYAGKGIQAENLILGYERIIWGVFKKVAIADHLAPCVNVLFTKYTSDGAMALIAAILCTVQLYMDFSGTIDVVIGTGKIFGINIVENFRQPFFAKDAGDFWRRWHITLGTFFRDYIFYPVSLSKPIQKLTKWTNQHVGKGAARVIGPIIALFLVWLSNGVWHGPHWTYIMYGLYYFVFMVLELFLKHPMEKFYEKHHITDQTWWLRIIRFFKVGFIVIIGEMLFRAETLAIGWTMFKSIFTNFSLRFALSHMSFIGMDSYDIITVMLCFIPVIIVSVLKERGVNVLEKFQTLPLIVRWLLLFLLIFALMTFGAYGPGYGQAGMMYAGF